MKDEVTNIIHDTIEKYSEYLEMPEVDGTNFLLHVMAKRIHNLEMTLKCYKAQNKVFKV